MDKNYDIIRTGAVNLADIIRISIMFIEDSKEVKRIKNYVLKMQF